MNKESNNEIDTAPDLPHSAKANPIPAHKAERYAESVRRIRTHWRRAMDAKTGGSTAASASAKIEGDHAFNELIEALKPTLAHLANAYFHDNTLTEDGICELIVMLYEKLRDLSGTSSALGWENPAMFWTALKRSTSNLFLREKQKEYGRQRSGLAQETVTNEVGEEEITTAQKKRPKGIVEVRQSELISGAQDSAESIDPIDNAADPDSENPLRALFASDELNALLAAIPNEDHRRALVWDINDVPHKEIARRLGVVERTVHNYIQYAKRDAYKWAAERQQEQGEFAEYFGGDDTPPGAAPARARRGRQASFSNAIYHLTNNAESIPKNGGSAELQSAQQTGKLSPDVSETAQEISQAARNRNEQRTYQPEQQQQQQQINRRF